MLGLQRMERLINPVLASILAGYVALSCPQILVVNQSTERWNSFDQMSLRKTEVRCREKYPDAPCLVKFTKRAPMTYWAICGKER